MLRPRSDSLLRKIAIVTPVILLCFAAIEFPRLPSPRSVFGASSSSICCGPGEDYELAWTYQNVPSNLTQAWTNYYTNSTFQNFKAKFSWNIIRLGFKFGNYSSSNEQFLNVSDFTNLDLAVNEAAQHGFRVILDDMDYQTNFYGSSTWYHDWNVTAEHYKGNSNIAFFEIANEMKNNNTGTSNDGCGTVGTQAIVCLDQLTDNIRSIDPTRAVGWWEYSLPSYPSVPPKNELRSNTFVEIHAADYANTSNCGNLTQFENWAAAALTYQNQSNMTAIFGELNMQNSNCDALGSGEIQDLISLNIPWVAWGYSTYSAEWIPILNNVNVSSSTSTTTTSPSNTTITKTTTATSKTTITTTSTITSTSEGTSTSTATTTIPTTTTTTVTASNFGINNGTTTTSTEVSTSVTTVTHNFRSTTQIPGSSSLASPSRVNALGILGLNQKSAIAVTYGSSTSIVIFVLGFFFGVILRNKNSNTIGSGGWRW